MGEEQGKRLPSQEPLKITSSRSSIEITMSGIGKKLLVEISPNGSIVTKVEALNTANEEKLEAEAQFTGITRNLIGERLKSKAAKQMPGSEEIGPELSADSLEEQFEGLAKVLQKMGYTEDEIKKLIREQGKQITIGETHMGEVPSAVREEVVDLSIKIGDFYRKNNETKQKKN